MQSSSARKRKLPQRYVRRCKWCGSPAVYQVGRKAALHADDEHDLCWDCFSKLLAKIRSKR